MKPFKAYDIRGIYPDEVNADFAEKLGKAFVTFLKANNLVVARDMRESGNKLHEALVKGITQAGANVIDIGVTSTPEFYFSLYNFDYDGGIVITASHNAKEYNGFKLCTKKAEVIFIENGFDEIQKIIENELYTSKEKVGSVTKKDFTKEYTDFFKNMLIPLKKQYKVLADTGNGMGITVINTLREIYGDSLQIDTLFDELDGDFPNHECNPIYPENNVELRERLSQGSYDFGFSTDGDADRIVFFLPDGTLIPPDLMTGVIGTHVAQTDDTVAFEVRTSPQVSKLLTLKGINPLICRTGRSYIINKLKEVDGVFGGEASGHYFYKELHYTDSPLRTVMDLLHIIDSEDHTLYDITKDLLEGAFRSGDLTYHIKDPKAALAKVKESFAPTAMKILEIDGLSIYNEFYSFNLHISNTEPVVRLVIEGNGPQVVEEVKEKIESIINN